MHPRFASVIDLDKMGQGVFLWHYRTDIGVRWRHEGVSILGMASLDQMAGNTNGRAVRNGLNRHKLTTRADSCSA